VELVSDVQPLMMETLDMSSTLKRLISVYCEKLTKHMNALCGRSAGVKAGGAYANNYALKS
jgi:hypothetical protein